jgi:hypothetical protein
MFFVVLYVRLVPLQEAVDIVQRSLDRGCHDACQELIETAAARWQEEEGDYRDDVRFLRLLFCGTRSVNVCVNCSCVCCRCTFC